MNWFTCILSFPDGQRTTIKETTAEGASEQVFGLISNWEADQAEQMELVLSGHVDSGPEQEQTS